MNCELGSRPIKRILIRAVNWIGDAVMTTPAINAVRQQFPDAEIAILATPLVAELFYDHPSVDRVIVYQKNGDHKGLPGILCLSRELRAQRFGLAILLQNAIEAAIIARLAGIPVRAGYPTDGRRLLLNCSVVLRDEDKLIHHTKYYLQLVQRLGIGDGQGELLLHCNDDELNWARSILQSDNVITLNPGAAYGSAKRWIPERFATVADTLAQRYDARILLTGGPGEVEIGRDIENEMDSPAINMIGKTSVRQMMSLLAISRLVISNDSGPMHVASAFNIPIVAVFGPTDHTTTCPASENFIVVRKETDCAPCLLRQCPIDHRCMTAISADDVVDAAVRLLEGSA